MIRKRQEPGFRKLAAAGVDPELGILVTRFIMAEAAWAKLNRKPDYLWFRAKDAKQKAALANGGSHPLRRAADAAWAEVDRAEKAVRRYRPRTWAELVVQMRFDAYVGIFGQPRADELLPGIIADARRLSLKRAA